MMLIKTDFYYDELALEIQMKEGEHTGQKAKDIFCKNWDKTRIGLVALKLILSKKWMASLIIGAVIAIGDGIKERFC